MSIAVRAGLGFVMLAGALLLIVTAPHAAPVRRLDEATAARQPNLRWRGMTGAETPCPD